jgi:hypothetical protein
LGGFHKIAIKMTLTADRYPVDADAFAERRLTETSLSFSHHN